MSSKKVATVTTTSSDTKGSSFLQYDETSLVQQSPIQLKWMGGTLLFATVVEYRTFFDELALPLSNLVRSSSGSGSGYVAGTSGTDGSDSIHN